MSLLPICSKIFEKLIFDTIYDFIKKLFQQRPIRIQNRPNDSFIHQLIVITHNSFSTFYANPCLGVPGIFLDSFKAFDGIWHDSLLYRLKSNRTDDNLFKLITSFLNNRCQRVVLNGQSSVWKLVAARLSSRHIIFSYLH